MKKSARLSALLLAIIISLVSFFGCTDTKYQNTPTNTEPTEPTEPTVTVTSSSDIDETTAEPTDQTSTDSTVTVTSPSNIDETTTEPEIPEEKLSITAENVGEYTIVRPKQASDELVSEAALLRMYICDTVGNINITSAWGRPNSVSETAKEIVVGNTNRPANEKILSELRVGEFAIVYEGERIYIIGSDDDATVEGIKYFKENYIFGSTKSIEFTNKLAYYNEKQFPIGEIKIDGVDLFDYTVVIPSDADLFTKYAAENLSDFVLANMGMSLSVTTDKTAESQYEILIGNTSRSASSANVAMKDSQYVLYKKDSKIVCLGNSYMVGGGISALIEKVPTDQLDVKVEISNISSTPIAVDFKFKEAKSAILMIGDGMGFNTVKMAKSGALDVKGIGEFLAEELPYQGAARTSSLSDGATDSAASATALSSGYKTINGYLGVDSSKRSHQNIRELAASKGAKTAVITTDVITGATPGGFLVHHASRNDTAILQSQINTLINNRSIDYCKGEVGDSLTAEAAEALRNISAGGSEFFMMIEAAQIDKRSHKNDYSGCINMVRRYNDVIAYVIEFIICHPDTALVITADHECGAIVEKPDGSFVYTSDDHSTENVPIYALGYGMDEFNNKTVENTAIPKTLAKIFGDNRFGR